MLKRTLLSALGGVAFSAALLAVPSANAACQGYCADKTLKDGCESTYQGCTIQYDANDKPYHVDCFYTNSCGPAPEEPPAT